MAIGFAVGLLLGGFAVGGVMSVRHENALQAVRNIHATAKAARSAGVSEERIQEILDESYRDLR
jgi:hypothetical protein